MLSREQLESQCGHPLPEVPGVSPQPVPQFGPVLEQVEDPKHAKGLVRRDITRVVTPGTLTDDALLDPRESNYLAAAALGDPDRPSVRLGRELPRPLLQRTLLVENPVERVVERAFLAPGQRPHGDVAEGPRQLVHVHLPRVRHRAWSRAAARAYQRPAAEAARALGAPSAWVLRKHIFPHTAPIVFLQLIFFVPAIILAEAGLSFLGLGDPSLPTWGQILEDGFRTGAVFLGYWWWVVAPGLLIVLTAVTFMLLALAMEPVVNPRLRRH